MNRLMLTVMASALATALPMATPARSQVKTPPSWDALTQCADMTDATKGWDCFQDAMKAAGYARNPQVALAERHKTFGLALPSLPRHEKRAKPPKTAETREASVASPATAEDENRITVQIVEVAYTQPLKQLLIVTSDGGVWEQVDTIPLTFTPRAGQSIEITKTRFGGYFCKFDRTNAVRCVRKN